MLSIKQFARAAVERAQKDKDLAIIITGPEGDGKSALAVGLGMEIDPLFEMERNVLFSPGVKQIKQRIYNLPPYSVIIADEAIKILYKLNWQSKVQKYLNTIYTLCRNQNKISIFNVPRLIDANEYFRNHRIKIWIHIIDAINNQKKEGMAVVMSRSWNPVTIDPWGLKIFEKRMDQNRKRGKKDTLYDLDDKLSLFSELPSYVDLMRFEWVDDRIWREYEALKDKYSIKDDDDIGDDKMLNQIEAWKSKTVLATRTFVRMGFSNREIGKLFDVPTGSISSWIKNYKQEEELKQINQPVIR